MPHCATKRPQKMSQYSRLRKAQWDRPPKLHGCAKHLKVQFNATFNFFMASAFTVFEAGLKKLKVALN
jgi:hypothetical protein